MAIKKMKSKSMDKTKDTRDPKYKLRKYEYVQHKNASVSSETMNNLLMNSFQTQKKRNNSQTKSEPKAVKRITITLKDIMNYNCD